MSTHTIARWRLVMGGIVFIVVGTVACVSTDTRPMPRPAIEYVARAFNRYSLVALSEWHGSPETMDFVRTLVLHDGFTDMVADIVVEFGNARYQRLVDRYIQGENVAHSELKQVWENTTQVSGVWSSPIYENFFADIRAFNQSIPVNKRIRVLLGDPPSIGKA